MKEHKSHDDEFDRELHDTMERVSRVYLKIAPDPKILESVLSNIPSLGGASPEISKESIPSPFSFALGWKVLAPAFVFMLVVGVMVRSDGMLTTEIPVGSESPVPLAMNSRMADTAMTESVANDTAVSSPDAGFTMMAKGAGSEAGVSTMSFAKSAPPSIPVTGGVDDILAQIEADVSGDQNLLVNPDEEAALVTYDSTAANGFTQTYDETTI